MNPLILQLFQRAIPYAIAACVGFAVAFYVQGLRITAAKQELVAIKQAAVQQQQEEKAKHQKLNEETSDAWTKNLNALHECYRSGRCGVRPQPGGMPSGGISAPASRANEAGAGTIPSADRIAADCAEVQLMQNMLQDWNEKVGK